MPLEIRRLSPSSLDAARALLTHPSLAPEFHPLGLPATLEDTLADPFFSPEASPLALVDGVPAGLCITFALPGGAGAPWAGMRLGVIAPHRRRGVGRALVAAASASLARLGPALRPRELALTAWVPNPEAEAFAAALDHRRVRSYWRMDRPAAGCPAPIWPADVELRTFDGSDAALRDWNDVYNASFARHYHYVPSTVEICRAHAARERFRPDGTALAYRVGRAAGFCRCEWIGDEAEVALLGVAPAARGLGLGRALLRWGVRYLAGRGAGIVTLRVDGDNESALALYRSEQFEVTRTRAIWSRGDGLSTAG